jgi:ubiquitin-conjugating enzyme E2 D/E
MSIVLKTPIYHPNFGAKGEVCLPILQKEWKPVTKAAQVVASLYSRLATIDPTDALQVELATQWQNNRVQFEQTAKDWTTKYASEPDPAPPRES